MQQGLEAWLQAWSSEPRGSSSAAAAQREPVPDKSRARQPSNQPSALARAPKHTASATPQPTVGAKRPAASLDAIRAAQLSSTAQAPGSQFSELGDLFSSAKPRRPSVQPAATHLPKTTVQAVLAHAQAASEPLARQLQLRPSRASQVALFQGLLQAQGMPVERSAIYARDLEACIAAAQNVTESSYRNRCSAVFKALQDAGPGSLAARILAAELDPAKIASMPEQELAKSAMQAARANIHAAVRDTLKTQVEWQPDGPPCPHCQHDTTRFHLLRAPVDTRKSEVWGSKDLADKTPARFECPSCGATWRDEL